MKEKISSRRFWKEPMMWVVVGIPLASIVAGIWLITMSIRSGGSDAVTDKVQRVSQIQTTDIGPDERARELKLSAVLQIRKDTVELIPVTGEFGKTALTLLLEHPAQATADKQINLQPSESGWRAEGLVETTHDWKLQLNSADGSWRLRGRLLRDTAAARLAPAHETE